MSKNFNIQKIIKYGTRNGVSVQMGELKKQRSSSRYRVVMYKVEKLIIHIDYAQKEKALEKFNELMEKIT